MAFLTEYGLFLAKTITLLLAIGAVILMVVSSRQPKSRKGELVVTDLSSELEQGRHQLQAALAGKTERKQLEKARKAEHKARAKSEDAAAGYSSSIFTAAWMPGRWPPCVKR